MQKTHKLQCIFILLSLYTCLCICLSSYVCICLQLVYLATRTGCVLILMAPQSPRLACNNEDSTFNNLDRQIKKRIQQLLFPMSTPSPRPLSFNAASPSPYRQLLSIIRWLGKMASATPEELLLCSLLSVGCGLERYRNSKKSLVVELKGQLDITPLTTHTQGLTMFL